MIQAFVDTTRCNPNQTDPDKWTPLTIAIRDWDMALFRVFFDCPRTDLNVGNGAGETALVLACNLNNIDVVAELIASQPRCDINQQDEAGKTGLMHAINSGAHRAVKLYLEQPTLDWVRLDKEGKSVVDHATTSPSYIVRRIVRGRDRLLK